MAGPGREGGEGGFALAGVREAVVLGGCRWRLPPLVGCYSCTATVCSGFRKLCGVKSLAQVQDSLPVFIRVK